LLLLALLLLALLLLTFGLTLRLLLLLLLLLGLLLWGLTPTLALLAVRSECGRPLGRWLRHIFLQVQKLKLVSLLLLKLVGELVFTDENYTQQHGVTKK